MMEKLENHLRRKICPFRNMDKSKPSKGPYIRYKKLGLSLQINIFKSL